MQSEFDVVVFVWILREKNLDADAIAKSVLALYEQEVGVEELFPPPNQLVLNGSSQ